ncbi:hypothetical protein F2Q70_00002343 [Brassica cretica]|uniref:Uncharacterized protein n=1 Tax=Brassica cretica TaxID=69181 RepID=A0A8S9IMN3_BRACR|nr:hypothetical protein F2Q70_00002343 [Brassica cretica]
MVEKVRGIKPFVVRLGVKVRMTSFPARPLRSGFYVEVIRRVAADGIYMGVEGRLRVVISISEDARILAKRQILGSRIKVFDTMPRDVRDQCAGFRGISLSPAFGKHFGLTMDTNSGLPFSRQVIGAMVAQLFWLCMKAVLSFIAKDVVAKGLDHDTFVLSIREIKPKKLDTEPVRSQLRGDFLLGRDQAE